MMPLFDVEPESPLDVQSHEHDVGAVGLLLHGTIDLFGGQDAERVSRRRLHFVDAGPVEKSERSGIADAVGGGDLGSVELAGCATPPRRSAAPPGADMALNNGPPGAK